MTRHYKNRKTELRPMPGLAAKKAAVAIALSVAKSVEVQAETAADVSESEPVELPQREQLAGAA